MDMYHYKIDTTIGKYFGRNIWLSSFFFFFFYLRVYMILMKVIPETYHAY